MFLAVWLLVECGALARGLEEINYFSAFVSVHVQQVATSNELSRSIHKDNI